MAPVKMTILGKEVRMTAFNGSVPGPVLRVRQGDSILLRLRNRSGAPITLHPHGIRLDYRFDGAPGFIPGGEDFVYHIVFPDPGAFWYHSHYREDMAPFRKDMADHAMMGRFGNVFLTDGDTDFVLTVKRNEYLRFYVTNACNTRVINLGINKRWMKVVGSDNGKSERSIHMSSALIAPGGG